MRTQVAIIGAGPAGLVLGHLLHREGIETMVLEARSRSYVEQRIRAGVLEHSTASLLRELDLGGRMDREGLVHHGIVLRFGGRAHRVDLHELCGGKAITVYGQHELIKDLIAARLASDAPLFFEVDDVRLSGLTDDRPTVSCMIEGRPQKIECDFIAGCDGSHGVSRPSIPTAALTLFDSSFPYAWLGILAKAKPASQELIYAHHDRGFALLSMRSPEVSRLYVQCDPSDELTAWPDARIWEELRVRLSADHPPLALTEGPISQRSITPLRSFVVEPMQYGRLFLAGDAAHIVPATGAKGLNLAVADVHVLARSLVDFYRSGRRDRLSDYSARCLGRVWKVQRFSSWMTSLLHVHPEATAFDRRRQLAELEYLQSSRAASQVLAENYVGLPLTDS